MFGKIAGAAIGRRLARRNEGGTGMLVGALVPVLGKRLFGPVGLALGGAYVAKKLWDRRARARAAGASGRY
jgi:hypothetical protein